MKKINGFPLLIVLLFFNVFHANADGVSAYELIYDEQEPGTDSYQVKFIVTERYLRIDQLADKSGYIVYDDKERIIYSVAHHDKSILVIPQHAYQKPDLSKQVNIDFFIIPDAPTISGKAIYNYRVTSTDKDSQTCMDIKLAEGWLVDLADIFMSYLKVLAGQQSRLLNTTPEEYRSACFLADQVFNEGDYYSRGLPIQEWHSNGRSRMLASYRKLKVDPAIFQFEQTYQKYSLD